MLGDALFTTSDIFIRDALELWSPNQNVISLGFFLSFAVPSISPSPSAFSSQSASHPLVAQTILCSNQFQVYLMLGKTITSRKLQVP